jgi:three-Cys-motif partner protein
MREFALCDNEAQQVTALESLRDAQPETAGRSVHVFHGDFNEQVATILDTAKIGEKTATFCLLDQRTFECDWDTVRKVACRKTERKIEIFYFVPTGWLARSISALNDPGPRMSRWWGTDEWEDLRGMNKDQTVEAFRLRFVEEFGYKHAHGWPIYDRQGSQKIMYHMVHASDHDEAPNLMSRAYKTATRRAEPREQFTFEFERFAREHGRTIEMDDSAD